MEDLSAIASNDVRYIQIPAAAESCLPPSFKRSNRVLPWHTHEIRQQIFHSPIELIRERDHDRTGCKRPSTGLLCANNCGFFGCPATMNLCSECYKSLALREESSLSVKALGVKLPTISLKEEAIFPSASVVDGEMASTALPPHVSDRVETAKLAPASSDERQAPLPAPERPNTGRVRCLSCRRRVDLLGFSCRCGGLFCASHRYSDRHECTFDYKAAARDAIARNNPVVKAEKVQRI